MAWACISVACTGSENQLFMPAQLIDRPPPAEDSATPEPDAATRDAGGPASLEDASVLRLNPDLDPDATFVWLETQPGHAGACEPGVYTGSFECRISALNRLVGSIELTLGAGADSDKLDVSRGKLIGFAGGISELFAAPLEGELACTSAELTASITKTEAKPFAAFGDDFGATHVQGTLSGRFDAEALSIQGDVTVTAESGWQCVGTFTARAVR